MIYTVLFRSHDISRESYKYCKNHDNVTTFLCVTEAEKHQCNLENRIHKMVILLLETRTNLNSENEQSTL